MVADENPFARWIEAHSLKRIEVARLLGVSPSQITAYCALGYVPSASVARRIRNLTAGAVKFDDFVDWPTDPPERQAFRRLLTERHEMELQKWRERKPHLQRAER